MPEIIGTFSGSITTQSAIAIPQQPLHVLVIAAVSGRHTAPDTPWDNAKLVYCGMGDLKAGNGMQSGYFHNEHTNGDTTSGTFEATVAMSGYGSQVEGVWNLVDGTGKFSGIKGGGKFQARSTTPVTVEMAWDGEYSLPS